MAQNVTNKGPWAYTKGTRRASLAITPKRTRKRRRNNQIPQIRETQATPNRALHTQLQSSNPDRYYKRVRLQNERPDSADNYMIAIAPNSAHRVQALKDTPESSPPTRALKRAQAHNVCTPTRYAICNDH